MLARVLGSTLKLSVVRLRIPQSCHDSHRLEILSHALPNLLHSPNLSIVYLRNAHQYSPQVVGSTEAPSKIFLLFFLLPDWLELNHLKSRMECGFSDIFSRHICSTVEETIGVTNNSESFGAKKCSENHI